MATSKRTSPDVTYKVLADGSHAIGVIIDDVFVPLAKAEGAYVSALVAAGKSPEAAEAQGTTTTEDGS